MLSHPIRNHRRQRRAEPEGSFFCTSSRAESMILTLLHDHDGLVPFSHVTNCILPPGVILVPHGQTLQAGSGFQHTTSDS